MATQTNQPGLQRGYVQRIDPWQGSDGATHYTLQIKCKGSSNCVSAVGLAERFPGQLPSTRKNDTVVFAVLPDTQTLATFHNISLFGAPDKSQ